MGRKMLLKIIRISAQNRGFTNTRNVSEESVTFSNGRMISRKNNVFHFQNFNDKSNMVNVFINIDNNISPDLIKIIKRFLSDEFNFDGEEK